MIIVCPSNPFVSVDPILAVDGMREKILHSPAPVVAVSPIIGGEAVKGPAAQMLASLGHEVSAAGVAAYYGDLIDVIVIDEVDRPLDSEIEALGTRTAITKTLMKTDEDRQMLARYSIEAGSSGGRILLSEPVTAVIPIKRLGNVKRRLATRLRSWERAALVLRLFDRQVKILAAMPEIERVIVVTADARVKTLAEMHGAVVALQPDEGVNAAVQAGVDEAFGAGATAVLAIHADLPFIEAIDIRKLLGASTPSVFAIAPDRRKRGTNAIVLRRGMDIELQFGVDSCHRFLAASELARYPGPAGGYTRAWVRSGSAGGPSGIPGANERVR